MNLNKILDQFDTLVESRLSTMVEMISLMDPGCLAEFCEQKINDKESLRMMPLYHTEQLDKIIGWDLVLATTNFNGTEKRTVFEDLPLDKVIQLTEVSYGFVKKIYDDLVIGVGTENL